MHDDLGLYVLGALDDPREFEAHLASCAECQAELAALRRTLDLADPHLATPPAPPGLKAQTLSAVRAAAAAPPKRERRGLADVIPIRGEKARRWASLVAVAALAAVVAGIGVRSFTRESFSADRVIRLAAADGGAARGEARIDDTANGQVIELVVSGLRDAPTGFFYECWWVGEGDADDVQNRVSAGTFRGGNGTYRMQSSADPMRFQKMGVTLEPDDGNPKRTGEKVLVSEPAPGTTNAPATSAPAAPLASPTTAPGGIVPTSAPATNAATSTAQPAPSP
jgi:hypothetical protein